MADPTEKDPKPTEPTEPVTDPKPTEPATDPEPKDEPSIVDLFLKGEEDNFEAFEKKIGDIATSMVARFTKDPAVLKGEKDPKPKDEPATDPEPKPTEDPKPKDEPAPDPEPKPTD